MFMNDTAKKLRAMELINDFADLGLREAQAAIGMLIDTVCARYGEDPKEYAQDIADVVRMINDDLGAYREV